MEVKTVGLASDHAGYALKQFVKEYLAEKAMPTRTLVRFRNQLRLRRLCPSFGTSRRRRRMLSGHSYMRQWRRYQHDAEQAPRHTRRLELDSGNRPFVPSAQRCQCVGHAGTFHRHRHGTQNHGRILRHGFRGRSPSKTDRQNAGKIIRVFPFFTSYSRNSS